MCHNVSQNTHTHNANAHTHTGSPLHPYLYVHIPETHTYVYIKVHIYTYPTHIHIHTQAPPYIPPPAPSVEEEALDWELCSIVRSSQNEATKETLPSQPQQHQYQHESLGTTGRACMTGRNGAAAEEASQGITGCPHTGEG